MNSDMYLPIGTVLDRRYKVEKHLASGGFGNTYLVTTRLGNHKMVVKEFFMPLLCGRDYATNDVTISIESNRIQFDSQKRKFQKEAERIHSINHPNVVKVTDLFEENGTAYYVMDFIDGKSLSQLDKPMGEDVALGYMRQVLCALEYVHSQGVLHLDIKPSNIMVDKAGKAILIDFGASKLFDVDSENQSLLSTTAGIAYTPGYAPFEQMSNHVESLGLIVIFMLLVQHYIIC